MLKKLVENPNEFCLPADIGEKQDMVVSQALKLWSFFDPNTSMLVYFLLCRVFNLLGRASDKALLDSYVDCSNWEVIA